MLLSLSKYRNLSRKEFNLMRQFISENFPDKKGCLVVKEKQFHYLSSVLRLKVGDMIYVRLPNGKLQNMTLAKFDENKKNLILHVAGNSVENLETLNDFQNTKNDFHAKPSEKNDLFEIWLFMFIAKPQKMEQIVRQATECGVKKIVPMIGEFCQKGSVESAKKHFNANDERLKKIITEARQQSGSPVNTEFTNCINVNEIENFYLKNELKNDENLTVVLYEQSSFSQSFFSAISAIKNIQNLKRICLFVGAEGGISPNEIEIMKNLDFKIIHFDTNILRCETAALYGIAAIQSVIQESNLWQLKE